MSNGDEGGGASESEALDAAGEIAKGVGESVGGVTDAAGGDLAGAVGGVAQRLGGLADGLGGALPEGEARGALATAGAVVKTAGQLVGAGQALAGAAQGGDLGKAASGLGSLGGATDASRYIVPDNEVQKVLGGVGQAASVLQQGGQLLDGLGGGLGGQRNDDVAFNVEVNGADGQWGLTSVVLSEARKRGLGLYDRGALLGPHHVARSSAQERVPDDRAPEPDALVQGDRIPRVRSR